MTVFGCSHYKGALAIDKNLKTQVKKDLAVGGILTRQTASNTKSAISPEASKLLMNEIISKNVTVQLSSEELELLLSGPTELSMSEQTLRNLKDRIGHRFVIVGEQGGYPISRILYWDIGYCIFLGAAIICSAIPVKMSEVHDYFRNAKRIIRVIDLDQARIIGESYEVLRDEEDGNIFTSGQISDALDYLNF
jgi:hypothetical protein